MTSFLPVRLAVATDLLGILGRVGERLLDEHMGARFHRLDGELRHGCRAAC